MKPDRNERYRADCHERSDQDQQSNDELTRADPARRFSMVRTMRCGTRRCEARGSFERGCDIF